MKFYTEDTARVFEQLESGEQGLSSAQALERLERDGKNKLAEGKKISLMRRFLNQLADPMLIILMIAAVISGITSAYSGEGFADVMIWWWAMLSFWRRAMPCRRMAASSSAPA